MQIGVGCNYRAGFVSVVQQNQTGSVCNASSFRCFAAYYICWFSPGLTDGSGDFLLPDCLENPQSCYYCRFMICPRLIAVDVQRRRRNKNPRKPKGFHPLPIFFPIPFFKDIYIYIYLVFTFSNSYLLFAVHFLHPFRNFLAGVRKCLCVHMTEAVGTPARTEFSWRCHGWEACWGMHLSPDRTPRSTSPPPSFFFFEENTLHFSSVLQVVGRKSNFHVFQLTVLSPGRILVWVE